MLDMALTEAPPFKVIVVHSFSRFARDHFALEFQVRRLRKHGVRLVSITQDLGEDQMSVMIRQVFALFDEYQSKENAKHTFGLVQNAAHDGPTHRSAVGKALWRSSFRPTRGERPSRPRDATAQRQAARRGCINAFFPRGGAGESWASRKRRNLKPRPASRSTRVFRSAAFAATAGPGFLLDAMRKARVPEE